MPVPLGDNAVTSATDRKAVFFCPDCGREERVDGDWITRSNSSGYEYVCSDCQTVVVTQPRIQE